MPTFAFALYARFWISSWCFGLDYFELFFMKWWRCYNFSWFLSTANNVEGTCTNFKITPNQLKLFPHNELLLCYWVPAKTQLTGTLLGTIIQIFILRYKKTCFHIDSVHGNFFDKIVIFFLQSSRNCWKRFLKLYGSVTHNQLSLYVSYSMNYVFNCYFPIPIVPGNCSVRNKHFPYQKSNFLFW